MRCQLAEEGLDRLHEGFGMRVVRRVGGAVDRHEVGIGKQPGQLGGPCPEHRRARGAGDEEDRRREAGEALGWVHSCGDELARDGVGRRDPGGPDRVGAVRGDRRVVHAHHPAHERLHDGIGIAGLQQPNELRDQLVTLEALAARRRRTLVAHEPPQVPRQLCRPQPASATVRVADHIDRRAGLRG